MKYLLDTCVLSELVKMRPAVGLLDWLRHQRSEDLYVSFLTLAELQKGIVKRGDDERARYLKRWFEEQILVEYGDRLLPFGRAEAMAWGRICGEAERLGKPRSVMDSLIASIAVANGMTLVTRNVSDMEFTGAEVLNPWAGVNR